MYCCVLLCTCARAPMQINPVKTKERWASKITPSRNTILFGGAEQCVWVGGGVSELQCCLDAAAALCAGTCCTEPGSIQRKGVTADLHRLLWGTACSHISQSRTVTCTHSQEGCITNRPWFILHHSQDLWSSRLLRHFRSGCGSRGWTHSTLCSQCTCLHF